MEERKSNNAHIEGYFRKSKERSGFIHTLPNTFIVLGDKIIKHTGFYECECRPMRDGKKGWVVVSATLNEEKGKESYKQYLKDIDEKKKAIASSEKQQQRNKIKELKKISKHDGKTIHKD